MRDFWLFLGCVALALGVWGWNQDRLRRDQVQSQHHLYRLGATDGLTPSPERDYLSGEFLRGLQATPSPDTYEDLAEVFLVSHDLGKGKVRAYAFNEELMGRALDQKLQFFDPQGRPLQPTLSTLHSENSLSAPIPGEIVIQAEDDWLLTRQKGQYGAYRLGADGLRGYLSEQPITVESERLTVSQPESSQSLRWDGRDLHPE